MASAYSAYQNATANGASTSSLGAEQSKTDSQFTLTALGRWSILNKPLPAVETIKAIHVYDFDNTLFKTALPNPSLWSPPAQGLLSNPDKILQGGWWQDNRMLAATGQGLEKEEVRAWEGWWVEKVVELVQLSLRQPDALAVLLTGRSEHIFSDLIKRMIQSKKLDFDMVGLKPKVGPSSQTFRTTMQFKQAFLTSLLETYPQAEEMRIYEDRPKHTKAFEEFLDDYGSRKVAEGRTRPLKTDVIQITDDPALLDPIIEVAEVQKMLNVHNDIVAREGQGASLKPLKIKKTVFFTSYLIGPANAEKLKKLIDLPRNTSPSSVRYLSNHIMICPRPCSPSILAKLGGLGASMSWQVNAIGHLDHSLWAVQVRPVPQDAVYHTESDTPMVVIAHRKGTRPADANKIHNWTPLSPEDSFIFDTTVSEKAILRIEDENSGEDEYESSFARKRPKRKFPGDHDYVARGGGAPNTRGSHNGSGPRGAARGSHGRGGFSSRGNRNSSRGGGRGGRGRGGGHSYRSLDDMGSNGPSRSGGSGRPAGGGHSNGTDLQNYY